MGICLMRVSSWIWYCTGRCPCNRASLLHISKIHCCRWTRMISSYSLIIESSRSLKLWVRSTVPRVVDCILYNMSMPSTTAIPLSTSRFSVGRTCVASSSIGPSYTHPVSSDGRRPYSSSASFPSISRRRINLDLSVHRSIDPSMENNDLGVRSIHNFQWHVFDQCLWSILRGSLVSHRDPSSSLGLSSCLVA